MSQQNTNTSSATREPEYPPCIYCNSKNVYAQREWNKYQLFCEDCGARGSWHCSIQRAIDEGWGGVVSQNIEELIGYYTAHGSNDAVVALRLLARRIDVRLSEQIIQQQHAVHAQAKEQLGLERASKYENATPANQSMPQYHVGDRVCRVYQYDEAVRNPKMYVGTVTDVKVVELVTFRPAMSDSEYTVSPGDLVSFEVDDKA